MRIGGFGFGLPLGLFAAHGIVVEDVTLTSSVRCEDADRWIEPFMDPFATSFLRRLVAGKLGLYDAIIFMRESPGAVHAYQYACEFQRRGEVAADRPHFVLVNLIPAPGHAVEHYNRTEVARLLKELETVGWRPEQTRMRFPGVKLGALEQAQSEGTITAARAFELRSEWTVDLGAAQKAAQNLPPSRDGLRAALLGSPLGDSGLHALLETNSVLAFDQQGLDLTRAAQGDDPVSALEAYTSNPFASRQAADVYVSAIAEALAQHRIDHVFWQVDEHDDLWGWLQPRVRAAVQRLGAIFSDLGFLPRWPTQEDLAAVAHEVDRAEQP
jgi:hypothetical protein